MVHTVKYVDVLLYVHSSINGVLSVSRSSLPSARLERIPVEDCIVRMLSVHEGAKAVIRMPEYIAAAKKLLPPTQFEVDQMLAKKKEAMAKVENRPATNPEPIPSMPRTTPITGRSIIEKNRPVSDAERIKLLMTDLEDYAPGEIGDEYQAGSI